MNYVREMFLIISVGFVIFYRANWLSHKCYIAGCLDGVAATAHVLGYDVSDPRGIKGMCEEGYRKSK